MAANIPAPQGFTWPFPFPCRVCYAPPEWFHIGSHPYVQPGSILLPETPAAPGGNILKKEKTMKAVT